MCPHHPRMSIAFAPHFVRTKALREAPTGAAVYCHTLSISPLPLPRFSTPTRYVSPEFYITGAQIWE